MDTLPSYSITAKKASKMAKTASALKTESNNKNIYVAILAAASLGRKFCLIHFTVSGPQRKELEFLGFQLEALIGADGAALKISWQ